MKKHNRVRIVAGSAGGLWIDVPPHFTSRPIQDRVKQAIFSSLGDYVADAQVVELFAGSGGLGIEALSRGAASCTFVDIDPNCTKTILSNLQKCSFEGSIITRSVESFLQEDDTVLRNADLIILAPPYIKEPIPLNEDPLTELLATHVHPGTLIVWEYATHNTWQGHPDFETLKEKHYGGSSVVFLKKLSPAD